MRIGIYDPYLDTLGGGEKYVLSIASFFSKKAGVFVFWDDQTIIDKAQKRFNLDLSGVKTTKNIFGQGSIFKKLLESKKYDVIFYISDGSIPFLFSKKNILLFQFPANWVNGKSFLTKIKFKKINKVICYSQFVKTLLDKTFNIESLVVAPPVDIPAVSKGLKKENIILTVGRFTKAVNAKKQEVMVGAFKKMCDKGLSGWKFILIGSVLEKDKDFVEDLKQKAKSFPIEILDNVSYKDLVDRYKKAKIYWHAAGFGEDLEKYPERAEHFGISTVEAMSAGAVPVVFNAGGQIEIVEDGESGLLWETIDELINKTNLLIKNPKLWEEISEGAKKKAKIFNAQTFYEKLDSIIK